MSWSRARAIASIAGGIAAPFALVRAARAQTQPLRIAYIPTENCAQVYYAQEQGFFAKAGLEVHLEPINFSAAIASAVLAGSIDIGNISTLTMTVAHNKRIPLVYIAAGNAFLLTKGIPDAGILVAATSPIRAARDLNGKTFGCSGLGSFGEFIPRAWVDANGGDSATMKFVELPNAELAFGVTSGRVDAAFVSPPAFGKGLKEGCRMLAVASDAVAKEFMGSGWFATAAWADAHPAVISAFIAALRDATAWARANPDKAVDILARYLKLEPSVLASAERVTFLDRLEPRFLQPPINVVARYSKFPQFPAGELIYVPPRT
jgi:NitT/TauT family transport system substrate-binding protein